MSRISNLVEFCSKIGIFKACPKTNVVTFGPYGKLILSQIKEEWKRANLKKFHNNFLINWENAFNEFDFDYYTESLEKVFGINKLPVGLIKICSKPPNNDYNLSEKSNFLMKNFYKNKQQHHELCYLSAYRFYDDSSMSFTDKSRIQSLTAMDPLSLWQRERKNWWSKILNFPEFVTLTSSSSDTTSISYKNDDALVQNGPDNDIILMESINHLSDLNEGDKRLKSLIKSKSEVNFIFKDAKHAIITETSAENVLESILNDSIEYRRKKSDLVPRLKHMQEKEKIVFRLNFRLAPFKACILYENQSLMKDLDKNSISDSNNLTAKESNQININGNLNETANDLRKMLYYAQINTFSRSVNHESEMSAMYEHLDEMGVPFSIFIPSTITKDGICRVRNRETTLEEHLHISLVVKQFSSISNALSF